jgi:hypothetical protein
MGESGGEALEGRHRGEGEASEGRHRRRRRRGGVGGGVGRSKGMGGQRRQVKQWRRWGSSSCRSG